MLMLCLLLSGAANSAFSASKDPERILLSLSDEPEFTFTMPIKSSVRFSLLTTGRSAETREHLMGSITISDQDCALGHQVSIRYEKKRDEILTTYFSKEIPWGTTYTLKVSRDAKTDAITVNLNGEIISVKTYEKVKFISLVKNPSDINILNIKKN